jgi:hypothetical protein
MSDKTKHIIVGTFPSHVEAESAVLALEKVGCDMHKVSMIGKDYQTSEHVRGFMTWKDTTKTDAVGGSYWGSFFGGLFGTLTGAGLLFIPGTGAVLVAGPIAGVMAGWLEGTVVGGSGAAVAGGLAGALVGLGIGKDSARKYESDLKAGKFVVLVTGTDEDVSKVQDMLQNTGLQFTLAT